MKSFSFSHEEDLPKDVTIQGCNNSLINGESLMIDLGLWYFVSLARPRTLLL